MMVTPTSTGCGSEPTPSKGIEITPLETTPLNIGSTAFEKHQSSLVDADLVTVANAIASQATCINKNFASCASELNQLKSNGSANNDARLRALELRLEAIEERLKALDEEKKQQNVPGKTYLFKDIQGEFGVEPMTEEPEFVKKFRQAYPEYYSWTIQEFNGPDTMDWTYGYPPRRVKSRYRGPKYIAFEHVKYSEETSDHAILWSRHGGEDHALIAETTFPVGWQGHWFADMYPGRLAKWHWIDETNACGGPRLEVTWTEQLRRSGKIVPGLS